MSKSTKSYEERLLEMERREQESLEKANANMQHRNGNYRSGRKPKRVESVHTDFV